MATPKAKTKTKTKASAKAGSNAKAKAASKAAPKARVAPPKPKAKAKPKAAPKPKPKATPTARSAPLRKNAPAAPRGSWVDAYRDRAVERLDDVLDDARARGPWPALLGRVVEGFFAFEAEDEAFVPVWVEGLLTAEGARARARVRDVLAVRLAQAFEPAGLSDDEGPVVATLVLEVLAGLAASARREPEAQAEGLADEAKRVLLAYVASYLGLPDDDDGDLDDDA